ncbi:hypothetical protein [Cumulibacter manganitolerans]|uniref:hypothetical protein n=1 Tax=Cumulibacter manganitolerans TaxID=1884992 RepID=UPI001294D36D|nr:hypothetical protein [Cumulibacter manganitolerans]
MLDDNTQAIIAMAWARTCGLADDAFAVGSGRIAAADDAAQAVTVVALLGRTLLHGPRWAVEGAEDYADEALLEVHALLALAKDHAPRGTRVSALLYADEYVADESLEQARVTDDPEAVRDLLARCAPDDVDPDDLATRERVFVLLGEDDRPGAVAAYSAQQGIIADLVLAQAIDARGSGAIEVAAAVAMHDALDDGLIPQLRIGSNEGADLAHSLGFEQLGALATVALGD